MSGNSTSHVIASLTATSDIFDNRAHLNSSDNRTVTQMLSVETTPSEVKIKWSFKVPDGIATRRFSPVEWSIEVREFSKSYKKVTKVTDKTHNLVPKNYTLIINDLKPRTGYEVCFHSHEFQVIDYESTMIPQRNTQTKECFGSKNIICKEVVTKSDTANNLALASAISSASTFVVVVLVFCCCIPGLKKDEGDNVSRSFFRIRTTGPTGNLDTKERAPSASNSSPSASYQPVSSDDNGNEGLFKNNLTYLNPNEISAIKESTDTKIFVKATDGKKEEPKYVNCLDTNIDEYPGTPV